MPLVQPVKYLREFVDNTEQDFLPSFFSVGVLKVLAFNDLGFCLM